MSAGRVAANVDGLAKVGNSVLLPFQPMFCCLLKIPCLAHILPARLLPSLMLCAAFASLKSSRTCPTRHEFGQNID